MAKCTQHRANDFQRYTFVLRAFIIETSTLLLQFVQAIETIIHYSLCCASFYRFSDSRAWNIRVLLFEEVLLLIFTLELACFIVHNTLFKYYESHRTRDQWIQYSVPGVDWTTRILPE